MIARRCWLSPSTRTAAVVGRKDGTDPRSADSNTAVNPILRIFLKNFLYDRVLADIQTYMEMHDVTDCRRDKGPRLEEGNR